MSKPIRINADIIQRNNLDEVAYEGLTYRDIFENNNLIPNLSHYSAFSGGTIVSVETNDIHILNDDFNVTSSQVYFYSVLQQGHTYYRHFDMYDSDGDVFFRLSNVYQLTPSQKSDIVLYEGTGTGVNFRSYHTALTPTSYYKMRDVYLIDMNIFTTEPTVEQMDTMRKTYLNRKAANISTENFFSGSMGQGWRLSTNEFDKSSLEIDNILVRDTFRTHIFQKDIIKATNGQLYVSDSGVVHDIDDDYIYFKDDKSSSFNIGDIVKIKDVANDGSSIETVELEITGEGEQHNSNIDEIAYEGLTYRDIFENGNMASYYYRTGNTNSVGFGLTFPTTTFHNYKNETVYFYTSIDEGLYERLQLRVIARLDGDPIIGSYANYQASLGVMEFSYQHTFADADVNQFSIDLRFRYEDWSSHNELPVSGYGYMAINLSQLFIVEPTQEQMDEMRKEYLTKLNPNATKYTYTLAGASAPITNIESGMTAVRTSGPVILLNATPGPGENTPYIDAMEDGATKVRIGNLTGAPEGSGYGLYGKNVFLTGKITATSGFIGTTANGWNITGDKIETSDSNIILDSLNKKVTIGNGGKLLVGDPNNNYLEWDSSKQPDLNIVGNIGGEIGEMSLGSLQISDRLSIDEDGIIANDGSNGTTFHLNANTGSAFFKGHIEAASGTFAGSLEAATGSFEGEITAGSGSIGGWTIDTDSIFVGTKTPSGSFAPAGGITIGSDGHITSNQFRIDSNGNAYFAGELSIGIQDDLQTYVDSAEDAATTATTKAGEASTSATTSSASATTASTKAEEAETSATTASTKAGEAETSATTASTSATTATTKASEAEDSATTATTKAGEASASASNAAQSKTDAEAAAALAEAEWQEMQNQGILKDTSYDTVRLGTYGIRIGDSTGLNAGLLLNSGGLKSKDGSFILSAGSDNQTLTIGNQDNYMIWNSNADKNLNIKGSIGGEISDMTLGELYISDRIQLTESGIFAQDTEQNDTFSLYANTGKAYFAGELEVATGSAAGWIIGENTLSSGNNNILLNSLNETMTIGNIALNGAASGSNPVLNHSQFQLNADGSASFAGTLSVGVDTTNIDGKYDESGAADDAESAAKTYADGAADDAESAAKSHADTNDKIDGSVGGWDLTATEIRSGTNAIRLHNSGYIGIGTTSYDTNGIFLGLDSGESRLSLKSITNHLKWDGSSLLIDGTIGGNISEMSLGSLQISNRLTIDEDGIIANDGNNGTTFYLDANTGNAFFKGEIQATSGTFSGTLEAAEGTFEGNITGGTINIGTNFDVNAIGEMTAKAGTIGGFKILENELKVENAEIDYYDIINPNFSNVQTYRGDVFLNKKGLMLSNNDNTIMAQYTGNAIQFRTNQIITLIGAEGIHHVPDDPISNLEKKFHIKSLTGVTADSFSPRDDIIHYTSNVSTNLTYEQIGQLFVVKSTQDVSFGLNGDAYDPEHQDKYPVGSEIRILKWTDSVVNISNQSNLKCAGNRRTISEKYQAVSLKKVSYTEWVAIGALA